MFCRGLPAWKEEGLEQLLMQSKNKKKLKKKFLQKWIKTWSCDEGSVMGNG